MTRHDQRTRAFIIIHDRRRSIDGCNGNDSERRIVSDNQWYELIFAVASDHLEVGEIANRLETMLNPS